MRHPSQNPCHQLPESFCRVVAAHKKRTYAVFMTGSGSRMEANKKLIRDVIIRRAARWRPCQDLNYFAGFLIESFFVLNLFFTCMIFEAVMSTEQERKSQRQEFILIIRLRWDYWLINCCSFVVMMTSLFYHPPNVFMASRKCIIIKIWWLSSFLPQICPRFFTNYDH